MYGNFTKPRNANGSRHVHCVKEMTLTGTVACSDYVRAVQVINFVADVSAVSVALSSTYAYLYLLPYTRRPNK